MESCNSCKFFFHLESVCRFEPPKLVATPQGVAVMFPATRGGGWCGKYQLATTLPDDIKPEPGMKLVR